MPRFALINGKWAIKIFFVAQVAELYRDLEGGIIIELNKEKVGQKELEDA